MCIHAILLKHFMYANLLKHQQRRKSCHATKWMKLEDIMLSEINLRKTNTALSHL